jgi:hypothetical protein
MTMYDSHNQYVYIDFFVIEGNSIYPVDASSTQKHILLPYLHGQTTERLNRPHLEALDTN